MVQQQRCENILNPYRELKMFFGVASVVLIVCLFFFLFCFQDGRIKVGDQILAVDDEIVVGYPVEKVLLKCQE